MDDGKFFIMKFQKYILISKLKFINLCLDGEMNMARHRKEGNERTTIAVKWSTKDMLRRFAAQTKSTKTGINTESDDEVIIKILELYDLSHEAGAITTTYPVRKKE